MGQVLLAIGRKDTTYFTRASVRRSILAQHTPDSHLIFNAQHHPYIGQNRIIEILPSNFITDVNDFST